MDIREDLELSTKLNQLKDQELDPFTYNKLYKKNIKDHFNKKFDSPDKIKRFADLFFIPQRLQLTYWRRALNLSQEQVRKDIGFCVRRFEAGYNDITATKLNDLTDYYKNKSYEL